MKLISFNVNGIRSNVTKGFLNYLTEENPDIIGLQEVKATEDELPIKIDLLSLGYNVFWNSASKKGYSGTAVFTKVKPLNVAYGLGLPEHDEEGRIITLEFDNFYFITVYTPNSKRELERLEYRQLWDSLFLDYMKRLEINKPVIVCGDLNVAHKEIDLTNPKTNRGNAGFTDEERSGFQKFLDSGFIDTFRYFYPDKTEEYSWWSNFANSRERNIGWRIDYFLISGILKDKLNKAFIKQQVKGSDHCPVGIEIEL
ncbi:MAG: exodeoxyribonuclease III [Candidatus Gracilibacteria bacterium]|nr:exodeoxyribonuclease III [Candidatus Gracilibacteria bacterium]MDD2909210.1 exodeoxyribonuclease III [Candidatus Gracilibacteria bacterium]